MRIEKSMALIDPFGHEHLCDIAIEAHTDGGHKVEIFLYEKPTPELIGVMRELLPRILEEFTGKEPGPMSAFMVVGVRGDGSRTPPVSIPGDPAMN